MPYFMSVKESLIRVCRCLYRQFINFHFKNCRKAAKDLILFRVLSLVLLLVYTIMYSSITSEKSDVLKFLHGSRYISLEIVAIIYASGVAAFGISIEVYLFVPYVIVNCILAIRNCGSRPETITAIIWIVKIVCVFLPIELCYRNLRKLLEYKTNFNSSTRTMLWQALLFTVTMLFLCSPGLRALYDAINRDLPELCTCAIR